MNEKKPSVAARIWRQVHIPRVVSVFMAVLYVVPTAGGLLTIHYPPNSVSSIMGPELVGIWGWLLFLGGAIAIIPALFGWYVVERLGMLCLATSLAMYITTVVEAQLGGDGSRYTQLTWLVFGGLGVLALRLLTTIAYRFEEPR